MPWVSSVRATVYIYSTKKEELPSASAESTRPKRSRWSIQTMAKRGGLKVHKFAYNIERTAEQIPITDRTEDRHKQQMEPAQGVHRLVPE